MQSSTLAIALAFGICSAIDTSTIIEWNCNTRNQPSSTSTSTSTSTSSIPSPTSNPSIRMPMDTSTTSSLNASSTSSAFFMGAPPAAPSNITATNATEPSTTTQPCTPTEPALRQSDFFGWQYEGCFPDDGAGILFGPATTSTRMTPDVCRMTCTSGDNAGRRYSIYGLENGDTCICSYTSNADGEQSGTCDQRCTGDQCKLCGGDSSLDLYYNQEIALTAPTIPAQSGDFSFSGCYDDTGESKLLPVNTGNNPDTMTVDICVSTCAAGGYPLAGLEAGSRCYCGNRMAITAPVVMNRECNTQCTGALDQFCGGGTRGDRLQLYERQQPA